MNESRESSSVPAWPGRDRMILSKGHGCIALYVILADKGFFPVETLDTFCHRNSILGGHPELLLIGQPTRGVDIGAIEFIHRRLVALRDAGKALLVVSVELDEILALADRILVMHDGRIVGDVPRASASERELGLMMAGVSESS